MLRESLSNGQREEDLEIMILNVAGGMADIAAAHGLPIDDADLALGEDIAERYRNLWRELTETTIIAPEEGFKITEKIKRLNELGFDVDEVDLIPADGGGRLRMKVKVGGRNFHSTKLHRLTGVEALERQARQVLSDLHYFTTGRGGQHRHRQGSGRRAMAGRRFRADAGALAGDAWHSGSHSGLLRRAAPPLSEILRMRLRCRDRSGVPGLAGGR